MNDAGDCELVEAKRSWSVSARAKRLCHQNLDDVRPSNLKRNLSQLFGLALIDPLDLSFCLERALAHASASFRHRRGE